MRNERVWKPSKFVLAGNSLQASRDPTQVSISSRLTADLIAAALQKHIVLGCKGRLLDLGCGKAPLYEIYCNSVSSVICADWPTSFHKLEFIDVACDISKPLPFADSSFDSVLLTDVLEHISVPEKLVIEIQRILDCEGHLLGTVPFLYWLHEEPFDYFRYTEYALKDLAKNSGFDVVLVEPYGGGLDVVFDLLAKLLTDIHWRFGPKAANLMQCFGRRIRNTKFGSRLSSKNRQMPLGYIFLFCKN